MKGEECRKFTIDAQSSQDPESQNSHGRVMPFRWDAVTNNAVSAVIVSEK